MIAERAEEFERKWAREAIADVRDAAELGRSVDRAIRQIRHDPTDSTIVGYHSGTTYRRVDLDYAGMAIQFELDPTSLHVMLHAVGRPEWLDRIAIGAPVVDAAIDRDVAHRAALVANSRNPRLLHAFHQESVEERDLALQHAKELLVQGASADRIKAAEKLGIRASRMLDEVVVAQGHMLERAINRQPSAGTRSLENLVAESTTAATRMDFRGRSEHARIVAGVHERDWTVADAISTLPSGIRDRVAALHTQSLEVQRRLDGPGDSPSLGIR